MQENLFTVFVHLYFLLVFFLLHIAYSALSPKLFFFKFQMYIILLGSLMSIRSFVSFIVLLKIKTWEKNDVVKITAVGT